MLACLHGVPGLQHAAGPRGPAPRRGTGPVELRAREIRGRPDLDAVAEGDVELAAARWSCRPTG
jgi:hypothetical protein